MRKTLAATAATLLAAGGVLAGTTTPAAASACTSTRIVSTTISPKAVGLGVADPQGITVTTKVRTNGCRIDRVELGLYGPDFVGSYDLEKTGTSNGVTSYETGLRISPGSLPNTEAGRWHSYVTAWGPTVAEKAGPDFRLRRAAR